MGTFTTTSLKLEHVRGTKNQYRVLDTPAYNTGRNLILSVGKGFVTDLTSLPQVFQSFIAKEGQHTEASVLHDWLYTNQPMSRKAADRVYLEAALSLGTTIKKAHILHLGVRIGGWVPWLKKRKRLGKRTPEQIRSYKRNTALILSS